MPTIRESSTVTIRTRFFNSDKAPTTPSSARYRLTDITNNRVITDWTDITPAAVVDVFIPAGSNVIYRDSVAQQEHAFVVQADTGEDVQFTDEVHYYVKNLGGFTST